MGWLDDARKKAEDAAGEAKSKAQEKAAAAAVAAAGAAAKKSVGGFFESIVSSAEASLASAEDRARDRGVAIDGPALTEVDEAAATLQDELDNPTPDPLGEAVRAVERAALEESPPRPAPVIEAVPSDPFADARAAIAMAREARGLDPNGPPEPELPELTYRDPVESALAAAADARRHAAAGGSLGLAREEAAREQLAALKAAHGGARAGARVDDDTEHSTPSAAPKKRTL